MRTETMGRKGEGRKQRGVGIVAGMTN